MAKNEQQRQKKLAKKRSKELAKRKQVAREKNRLNSFDGQWQLAVQGPMDRCFLSTGLINEDMRFGSLIVSRKMSDGRVGVARFLIDGLCLGVKDTHLFFTTAGNLSDVISEYPEAMELAQPPAIRKFIEGVVAFARSAGFEPHRDYAKASQLLHDADPAQCQTEFTFGRDGKPLFITGPMDSPESIGEILATLDRTLGEEHYAVEYDGSMDTDDWGDDGDWADDPELDAPIDQDVIDAVNVRPT